MNIIEGLLTRINANYEKKYGPKAGVRSEGWEFPPKQEGDSDQIITREELDGTHTVSRIKKRDF